MTNQQTYEPEELSEAVLEFVKGGVSDFTVWRDPLAIVELASADSKLAHKMLDEAQPRHSR